MAIVTNPASGGKGENYIERFDSDDADWYIMQVALDHGDDPKKSSVPCGIVKS